MNARGHRVVAGLGLALAGVLLSGCRAQGTFDVLSEDRVAVDLTVSGPDVSCPNSADALKLVVTEATDEFGDVVCHVTGETQATYFSPFGITVVPAAEYLVLQTTLSGGRDSWPSADIAVRFPGKVVDATQGTIEDNIVRITDLPALTQGSGLRAVGLRNSAPPAWVLAALTGAGAGVVLTLAAGIVVWLLRRPARLNLAEPPQPESGPDVFTAPESVASPEVFADAESPPPATGSPGNQVAATPDTSWLARPPTSIDSTPAADGRRPATSDGSAPPPLQHAAWAPPEDH